MVVRAVPVVCREGKNFHKNKQRKNGNKIPLRAGAASKASDCTLFGALGYGFRMSHNSKGQ